MIVYISRSLDKTGQVRVTGMRFQGRTSRRDFRDSDDTPFVDNPEIGLTCTVLSRTTWDTVSRSCAAMPGFPRPRVNFLSLILANTVRRRSGPESVPSSDVAPATSGRIGHRARPRRGTIKHISRATAPAAALSQSIKIARPTPVGHHQSRPVLSHRAAPV